jgi:hypothetical protein
MGTANCFTLFFTFGSSNWTQWVCSNFVNGRNATPQNCAAAPVHLIPLPDFAELLLIENNSGWCSFSFPQTPGQTRCGRHEHCALPAVFAIQSPPD